MKDRLLEFIDYLGIPTSAFERRVGLSNAYIANFKGNISAEKLEKILNEYPELNRDWLLYGNGEMILENGETIKDRILTFIKHIEIPISTFERECGMSNATIQNMRSSIAPDKLKRIAEKYPQLNIEWLMIGKGRMLKETLVSNSETHNLSAENERLRQEIAELKADKAELQQTISTLRKALGKYL